MDGRRKAKRLTDLNHEMFTNKDGYVEGGKEIETTNPSEMQEERFKDKEIS